MNSAILIKTLAEVAFNNLWLKNERASRVLYHVDHVGKLLQRLLERRVSSLVCGLEVSFDFMYGVHSFTLVLIIQDFGLD